MTELEQARAAVNRRKALDQEREVAIERGKRWKYRKLLLEARYIPLCDCDICLLGIMQMTGDTCSGNGAMPIRRAGRPAPMAPSGVSVVFSPVDVPLD